MLLGNWCGARLGTTNRAAHFAAVALEGVFPQGAAGHFGDQGDHLGADGLVLAALGVAFADHLDPFFSIENSVLAGVTGDVGAFGIEKFRRGRGPAGGKNQGDKEEDVFHGLRMAQVG